MRREFTDLGAAALLTAAATLTAHGAGLIAHGTAAAVLQALGGVPLVLILPGYALSLLVLPGPAPAGSNAVAWRGMWAGGLSLAVTVLGGLALDLTPDGLTRRDWVVMLAAVTLVALGGTAVLRTRRTGVSPASEPQRQRASPPAARLGRLPGPAAAGLSMAALLLVGGAVWLGAASASWHRPPGFAQLWLAPGRTAHVTLGVRNAYPGTEHFHLVLQRGPRRVARWDLTLAGGATWRNSLAAGSQGLRAELTMPGQHTRPQQVALPAAVR